MPVAVPYKTVDKLSAIHDPSAWKEEVFRMIGNDMPKLNGNRVLCAVYIEPDVLKEIKSPTGMVKLYKSDDQKKESIWQSKTMMVLAVGDQAYVDTTEYTHGSFKVKPGDWVTARIANCEQIELKEMPCRVIADYQITMEVHDPRLVTS